MWKKMLLLVTALAIVPALTGCEDSPTEPDEEGATAVVQPQAGLHMGLFG